MHQRVSGVLGVLVVFNVGIDMLGGISPNVDMLHILVFSV